MKRIGHKKHRSKTQEIPKDRIRPLPLPRIRSTQLLEVVAIAVPTDVNVLLALPPKVVMAVMHTTMMRANITAYSTAVGPSSRFTEIHDRVAELVHGFATFIVRTGIGNVPSACPPKRRAVAFSFCVLVSVCLERGRSLPCLPL